MPDSQVALAQSGRDAERVVADIVQLLPQVRSIADTAAKELRTAMALLRPAVIARVAPEGSIAARAYEWLDAAYVRLRERSSSARIGATRMSEVAHLLEPVRHRLNDMRTRQVLRAAAQPSALTAQDLAILRSCVDAVNSIRLYPPVNDPSEPKLRVWEAQLEGARLHMARAMSAIAHRDALPPEPANLVHSRLLRASALLLEQWGRGGAGASPSAQASIQEMDLLISLLMAGQQHHRVTAHLGMPSGHMLPAFFETHSRLYTAKVTGLTIGGSLQIDISGGAHRTRSVPLMAHEGTHVAQKNFRDAWNTSAGVHFRRPYDPVQAHPRAGHLETAVTLGFHEPVVLPTAMSQLVKDRLETQIYGADHAEVQAFLEQASVHRLDDRDAHGAFPASAPLSVWRGVAAGLIDAANTLHTTTSDGRLAFEPSRHPEAAARVERILLATATLHDARGSKAWTPQLDDELLDAVRTLAQDADARPDMDGSRRLAIIAGKLDEFVGKLQQAAGDAVHSPARLAVAPEAFADASQRPEKLLLNLVNAKAARQQGPAAARLDELPQALAAAKTESGFREEVRRLLAQRAQRVPVEAQDVGRTVMRLAASLLGVPFDGLSQALMPDVNLYPAESMTLPHVAGLNVAAGHKRKALFEVVNWQLHVPQPIFDEPARLEARLAALAADVAYAVTALQRLGTRPEEAQAALGLDICNGWLRHIGDAAHRAMAPLGGAHGCPGSRLAAAARRAAAAGDRQPLASGRTCAGEGERGERCCLTRSLRGPVDAALAASGHCMASRGCSRRHAGGLVVGLNTRRCARQFECRSSIQAATACVSSWHPPAPLARAGVFFPLGEPHAWHRAPPPRSVGSNKGSYPTASCASASAGC